MAQLFSLKYKFNDNINNWDVFNVDNMENMFDGCHKYNQLQVKERNRWYMLL